MGNLKNSINILEAKIRFCLDRFPDTRNDDILLTQTIVEQYHPELAHVGPDGSRWLNYEAMKLVREDQVKRLRAHVQNDLGEFLPTDEDVIKRRRTGESRWQTNMEL